LGGKEWKGSNDDMKIYRINGSQGCCCCCGSHPRPRPLLFYPNVALCHSPARLRPKPIRITKRGRRRRRRRPPQQQQQPHSDKTEEDEGEGAREGIPSQFDWDGLGGVLLHTPTEIGIYQRHRPGAQPSHHAWLISSQAKDSQSRTQTVAWAG
jgi:hypothetical protein